MKNINGWRFPNNNYGPENGLDTGDVETFKKDPEAALAREISQNVIDAQYSDNPPRVEFKLFEIDRNDIPGIDTLASEIQKCYDYKKDSAKEGKSLKYMKDWIYKDVIKCLRISDFNTTGLIGVSTNERSQPFYNLTKGAGVSDKLGTSGGSKGIGKFASFVASTTNTVFYSTKTVDNEMGYIGISKLRSTPISNEDPDLMTIGIGYYAVNEKNEPILEELYLDPNFKRQSDQYGTDVYIIGFNDSEGWQNDITAKVLDSFMVAIIKNGFEVVVDNLLINRDTIGDIVFNPDLFKNRYKREVKDIKAQYELLCSNENVHSKDIIIGENSRVTVYVKQYTREEEKNATKRCIMVRYPYMKIMHTTGHSFLPYSALCIIHDNELNQKLRNIENPQHTDWEIKRLNEDPEEKKKTRQLKKEMEMAITDYIREVMIQSNSDSTDVEGAGDYLPSQDEESGSGSVAIQSDDLLTASTLRRVNITNPKTKKADGIGEGYEFATGSERGEDDGKKPGGGGTNPNPNPNPKPGPDDEDKIDHDGKEPVLKRTPLNGMRFKHLAVNKDAGRFDIVFKSLYDEDNCELGIKMCGESTDKYPINIISANSDGRKCTVKDGKIIGLKIERNKRYKIACELNIKELFSSEVILNAYR